MLKFYRTNFFPLKRASKKSFTYKSFVGIGGNEGDVVKNFKKLIRLLMDDRRVRVVQTSAIFKNPPFGYMDQKSFYNGVLLIQTSLDPFRFLRLLMQYEKRFKRVRSFKNAPRTLDLDIITFSNYEITCKKLTIPHPKWRERVSVIAPLVLMQKR